MKSVFYDQKGIKVKINIEVIPERLASILKLK